MLLTLTKPVIPLAVLIATGQSINNLIFSMVTSQVLRRAQKFSVEGIHLLVRRCLLRIASPRLRLHRSA